MLKIAGIQFHSCEDKTQNLNQAQTLAGIAADKGAKIICFQQLFALPWFPRETDEKHFSWAEDLSGETISTFSRMAAERQIVMICPIFEKTAEGKYFNTAVLIDTDGKISGLYRKIHIPNFALWWEKFYFSPGDLEFPVFDTQFGKIGIQLCWDAFFPEGFRILALKGADMIFCPTASALATKHRWRRVLAGHAIANNLYILRVNRVGKEEKQTFYGNSFCVDPHGDIIGEAEDAGQSVLLCDIDLEEVKKMRQNWAYFPDRRPEIYSELTLPRE